MALLSVLGFGAVLFTYFGVNYLPRASQLFLSHGTAESNEHERNRETCS